MKSINPKLFYQSQNQITFIYCLQLFNINKQKAISKIYFFDTGIILFLKYKVFLI